MRRLCAKFRLNLHEGRLEGTPSIPLSFLIPPLEVDEFGKVLNETLHPVVQTHVQGISVPETGD